VLKKSLICLLALVLALCLCACNSGGAQRGDNPVPDKAQSLVSINASSAVSSRDDSENLKILKKILEQQELWTAADKINEEGIAGFYATGYMFFDIDLDGNKELLVQLGTTDKLHCETVIYRFDNEGVLSELKKPSALSFSAEDLTLWTDDEGNSFYLNHYTKINDKGSQEVWNKLTFDKGALKETALFYINYTKQVSSTTSSAQVSSATSGEAVSSAVSSAPQAASAEEYFIAGNPNAVTKENFDKAFNEFRGKLTQRNVKTTFIKSTEWALYTDLQKENVLLSALKTN